MRMLLMISNRYMSLRALYTLVLDGHAVGWVTSFMSGMPVDAEAIVTAYDAVVFELGAPDAEDRVETVKRLRAAGLPVITHVEGSESAARAQDLEARGAIVVRNPVSAEHITAALDTLLQRLALEKAQARRWGLRGFIRRLLGGT